MRLNNTNVKVQQHLQEVMYKSDGYRFGGKIRSIHIRREWLQFGLTYLFLLIAVGEVFTHPKQDVLRGEINCVKKATGEVLYTWKYDT